MRLASWLRPVGHLVRKEFLQLWRDRTMLRLVMVMPLAQLFLLGYAATTDLKHVRLAVLDRDHTPASRQLITSFFQNDIFVPAGTAASEAGLEKMLERGKADLALIVPRGFAEELASGRAASLCLRVDGQNSNAAGRALSYARAVVLQAQRRFLETGVTTARAPVQPLRLEPVTRYFYNPELESRLYMIPGIAAILITMISGMLSGMAVVREKEIGTLEQLFVTPLSAAQFLAGKLIPFAALALVELAVATTIGVLYFRVPFVGSPLLLAFSAFLFLIVTLGGGLLASTISHTQQQAMFAVWFFNVFGILTSGFFYPVENMPRGIYLLSYANPLRFFMAVTRGIFLKGATAADLAPHLLALLIIGVVTFTIAALRFRKQAA